MEPYIKGVVNDITYKSELTPPSRRIKISNRFMNKMNTIEHKGHIISNRLEGGVNSSANELVADSLKGG